MTPSVFTIDPLWLEPLMDGITANIAVLLPWGLGIFAIFIGISLVPRIVRKFINA